MKLTKKEKDLVLKPAASLALDSEDLRNSQAEKFSQGMHELGTFAKEMKSHAKRNAVVGYVLYGVFALLLIGGLVASLSSGGIDSLWDRTEIARRFQCSSDNITDVVRSYEDASVFVDLYGGSCVVFDARQKEEKE